MEHILEVLASATASGEAQWLDVVNQLNARERLLLLDVLREQKRKGNYWRRVRVVDGASTVTIVKGRHPNLPPVAGGSS